jgi:osmoprotectant transport system ATP-binding protein
VIELRGVVKRFPAGGGVGPIDLAPEPRRTTVLLGPSGCGKSTLLRLMLGLLLPDSGDVLVEGQAVAPEAWPRARRRMGYVIQDGGLFPHLTALANAALVARVLGWREPAVERRVAELAELLRLPGDALGRYPVQLSGGQRQRVALMRALFLDPEVLLLDEPLAALDPIVRTDLQDELRSTFRALGKTVVLVTHDLAEAAHFGDQLVLLRDGTVVQRGGFAELVGRPAEPFVESFVRAQRAPAARVAGGGG